LIYFHSFWSGIKLVELAVSNDSFCLQWERFEYAGSGVFCIYMYYTGLFIIFIFQISHELKILVCMLIVILLFFILKKDVQGLLYQLMDKWVRPSVGIGPPVALLHSLVTKGTHLMAPIKWPVNTTVHGAQQIILLNAKFVSQRFIHSIKILKFNYFIHFFNT
jgi:hypothetical protein